MESGALGRARCVRCVVGASLPLLLVLAGAAHGTVAIDLTPPTAAGSGLTSGVDLAVATPMLQMSVDYGLRLGAEDPHAATAGADARAGTAAAVVQRIGGRLRSGPLNELLGVDAELRAATRLLPAGQGLEHRLDSVLSRRVAGLATVEARYGVEVQRAPGASRDARTETLQLRVAGKADAGRLYWRGSFRDSRRQRADGARGSARDVLQFASSYRLLPALEIDLDGRATRAWRAGGSRRLARDERRLRAGIAWQPGAACTVRLSLSRHEDRLASRHRVSASGSVSWQPSPSWDLRLRYADRLRQRGAGVILEASLKLGS